MNLVYGEILDLFLEDGMQMGRVRVGGARQKVSLELLTNAQPGDRVLVADGVALSQVQPDDVNKSYVFGNPG